MTKPLPYLKQVEFVEVNEEDETTLRQTYLPIIQVVEVVDETSEVFIEPD